ncbi:hypothetical protein EN35_19100 [Rhodococcus qingshengii]|nr:hypothetical protein EN35_19100 [Rhodococcus qingshengii]
MEGFWEFFWCIFVCFAFVAYLSVLFSIIADLFRDHETSGWAKALWMDSVPWSGVLRIGEPSGS